MLMAFFMFTKWWKFTIKKTFGYIINIYFENLKTLDKVYDDFTYWTSTFSNKIDVKIVYVFKVGIIKIILKFLFIRSNIFFSNFWLQNFHKFFFYLHFSLNFHYCFPSKNCQVKKFWIKKNVGWEGGVLIQLFKP